MSIKYPAGYVAIDKILKDSGVSELPCQMVIRYIDPAWKRYGYPHLSGDLRVSYNHGICEGTSIHSEDISIFINRLQRYMQSSITSITAISQQQQPKANFLSAVVEQELPIIVNTTAINKNRGCGCGRRR